MGRVLLLSLLLVGSGAAAQAPGAPPKPKELRSPPLEGVARPVRKAFDFAPALHYGEGTDCRAYSVRIALEMHAAPLASRQPPAAAQPAERADGCFIIRRETADPFGRPGRVDPDARI